VQALEEFFYALGGCAPDELLSYGAVADALEAEAVAEGSERRAESFRATAAELRSRAADRPHTP
jgi:hypothetical protein